MMMDACTNIHKYGCIVPLYYERVRRYFAKIWINESDGNELKLTPAHRKQICFSIGTQNDADGCSDIGAPKTDQRNRDGYSIWPAKLASRQYTIQKEKDNRRDGAAAENT